MILILIAIIAIIVLAMIGMTNHYTFLGEVICPVVAVLGFFSLFGYCVLVFAYISAGAKAEILNREYGTSYTQQEIFYASDVIDTIQELKRKRIELNDNLLEKEHSTEQP